MSDRHIDPYTVDPITVRQRACRNLGIEGVDLYGGTRHSSVRGLREKYSPEEIKIATMHSSNKAFERYFQVDPEDLRQIYEDTGPGKQLAKNQRRG